MPTLFDIQEWVGLLFESALTVNAGPFPETLYDESSIWDATARPINEEFMYEFGSRWGKLSVLSRGRERSGSWVEEEEVEECELDWEAGRGRKGRVDSDDEAGGVRLFCG